MKIIIKSFKHASYTMDVEPDTKISDVKLKIKDQYNVEVETQNLIYMGKFLEDDKTIGHYGVKDNEHIILYMKKPKKPTSVEKKPEPAPQTVETEQPKPEEEAPKPEEPKEQQTRQQQPQQQQQQPQQQIMEHDEKVVQEILNMGIGTREEVIAALNASFGNADVAVQYLLSGEIPDYESDVLQEDLEEGEGFGFETLRELPFFNQIKALVQQDPANLEIILRNIRAQSPDLYEQIIQNKEQFLQLLQEPVDPSSLPFPTQTVVIQSQEDRDAIERLCDLGFPKEKVIEAFLACDKNEELAANYLFESMEDE